MFKKVTLIMILLSLLCACKSTPIYKPAINQLNATNTEKVLLLLPLNHERDAFALNKDKEHLLLSHITQRLKQNGWTVVNGPKQDELWKQGFNQLQNTNQLYDKDTGKLNIPLLLKLERDIIDEMFNTHEHVKFVLDPRIIQVDAKLTSDDARWHGRDINTNNIAEDFLNTMIQLGRQSTFSGKIPASSLMISIYNPVTEVYQHTGGIELLGRVNKLSEKFVQKEQLFERDDDLLEAVNISLSPIASARKKN